MSGIKYPHGCDKDALDEMIEYTEYQRHRVNECKGPPVCGYCLDEFERGGRKMETVIHPDLPAVINPNTILEQAVTHGASVEVLERLMALQERWQANQAKRSFDAAMAAIRSDLPTIIKDRQVDYTTARGRTNYKYEDLHAVTEALSPVLSKHGLSFRWRTATPNGSLVSVTCIVSHSDGHSEETTLSATPDDSGAKNSIQAIGSAVTYLQRYTLKAALGIAAGMDDDGRSAGDPIAPSSKAQAKAPDRPAAAPNALRVSDPQRKRLWAICNAKGISEQKLRDRLALYGFVSGFEITRDKYEEICAWAEAGAVGPDLIPQDAPTYAQREPGDDDDNIPDSWPEKSSKEKSDAQR